MRTILTADAVLSAKGTLGTAIAIDDGTIVGIGDAANLSRPRDHLVEYDGGFIVPGFRDAHIHAIPYTALISGCSLKAATSIADLVDRLGAYARSLPEGAPVVATRFDDESLVEQRLPSRHDLDRAVPDRPAVIYRYCGHVAVANSTALRASGIDRETPDPAGGIIDREGAEPTGVLRETATGLVASALARGALLPAANLLDGLTRLAGLGITSIGVMVGYGESPYEKLNAESELFRQVASELPIRVNAYSIASTPEVLEASALTMTGAGDRLRWLGVKRFSDGSLGGHTAAMCSPFSDVDTLGTYRLTESDVEVSRRSLALGGMVAIHAIGDRAIADVLDVFDGLVAEGADPSDLRMEHVSVASQSLIARFAATGATAVVQPAFLASEAGWLGKRLGDDRMSWAYPFRSMMDAGITVSGSSDSPVEPPHPLWGMAAAMDRHSINEAEALTGLEALSMFTAASATAMREPEPMVVGSPGDLVVIDADLRVASASHVHDASVIDTYVGGERIVVDRSLPTWFD